MIAAILAGGVADFESDKQSGKKVDNVNANHLYL
jgi:hypothetical protein